MLLCDVYQQCQDWDYWIVFDECTNTIGAKRRIDDILNGEELACSEETHNNLR